MSTDTTTQANDQPPTDTGEQAPAPSDPPAHTRSFDDRDSRADDMHDALEDWVEELIDAVDQARASDQFQEWLDVHARFHDYSYRNTLLIKQQYPDATKVAGYWTWQNEFDRHVKEGEDAIWIWAPIITEKCPECGNSESYHDRDHVDCTHHEDSDPDDWDDGVVGFKPTSVFDVSQTKGEPLPELETDATAGDVDDPSRLWDALRDIASQLDVDVRLRSAQAWDHGDANGVCTTRNAYDCQPRIEIKNRDNTAAMWCTLVHEYAHALLHFHDPDYDRTADDRSKREVEVEAVAYLVCRWCGLDPSNSSFYIAAWSDDDAETIRDRLQRITDTAKRIIDAVGQRTTAIDQNR